MVNNSKNQGKLRRQIKFSKDVLKALDTFIVRKFNGETKNKRDLVVDEAVKEYLLKHEKKIDIKIPELKKWRKK